MFPTKVSGFNICVPVKITIFSCYLIFIFYLIIEPTSPILSTLGIINLGFGIAGNSYTIGRPRSICRFLAVFIFDYSIITGTFVGNLSIA